MLENESQSGRAPGWRGPVVLGFALAALATMLAILVIGPKVQAEAPTGNNTVQAMGQWQLVPPVTPNNLRDVFMVSANDGWAVGENGTALHYNGTSWQPGNISTTDTLVDVYMVT